PTTGWQPEYRWGRSPRPGLAPAAGPGKARCAPSVGLTVQERTTAVPGQKRRRLSSPPESPAPLRHFSVSASFISFKLVDGAAARIVTVSATYSCGPAVVPEQVSESLTARAADVPSPGSPLTGSLASSAGCRHRHD